MSTQSVEDRAGYIYAVCQEIVVAPNGEHWEVFNGHGGPHVSAATTAVLQYLEDNFDLPVQMADGSVWDAGRESA